MKTIALFAGLVAALIVVPARSAPCQNSCAPAYNQQAVVVAAPAIVLPLYGAAYTGESDAETQDLLRQLLKEIQALRADLQKGPPAADTGDGPPVPPLKAIDVVGLLKGRCASCHNAKVSEDRGGGFDLFNEAGQALKLPPAARRELVKKVVAGTMPPPAKDKAPLTPAEKEAIKKAMADTPAIPKAKN